MWVSLCSGQDAEGPGSRHAAAGVSESLPCVSRSGAGLALCPPGSPAWPGPAHCAALGYHTLEVPSIRAHIREVAMLGGQWEDWGRPGRAQPTPGPDRSTLLGQVGHLARSPPTPAQVDGTPANLGLSVCKHVPDAGRGCEKVREKNSCSGGGKHRRSTTEPGRGPLSQPERRGSK